MRRQQLRQTLIVDHPGHGRRHFGIVLSQDLFQGFVSLRIPALKGANGLAQARFGFRVQRVGRLGGCDRSLNPLRGFLRGCRRRRSVRRRSGWCLSSGLVLLVLLRHCATPRDPRSRRKVQ